MEEGLIAGRWMLRMAWEGAGYVGWQRQPDGPSIQSVLEAAVGKLCGTEAVAVRATGRTDAGVHAREQVVAVDLPVARSRAQVRDGLNHFLPHDIVCLDAQPAPPDFVPRRWVRHKRYRYRILSRPSPCPFRHGRVWHLRQPLDRVAMSLGAAALVGRHDFSSFRARGCSAINPVRTLGGAAVREEGDELVLDFVGHGFLRHQVRIMTGTLVEVGEGRRPAASIASVLAARTRSAAGRTAPAHGLWLDEVRMGDGPHRPGGP